MTATKQSPLEGQQEMFPSAANSLEIRYLTHQRIHPDPNQPRVEADAELKASIQAEGIRQPIQVRPHPELLGEYMILDGERRWQGAAGVMASVPVIVREDQEESARRLVGQLVSNNAKPLTPLEEARAFGKLLTETGWDQSELAQRLGIPRTTLGDRLRLLELGPWLDLIAKGNVSFSLAVKYLVPLRGVPADLHAEAIPRIRRDYRWEQGSKGGEFGGSASDFDRAVREVYKSYVYPLTKTKGYGAQPEFPTATHDAECSCGGVMFAFDDTPRKACGDPAWWKPKRNAVRRATKAKKGARSAKETASRTPAWAKLPDGATTRKVERYYHPAKGETIVIRGGKWSFGDRHSDDRDGFDPEVFLARADPAKLVYLPAVASQYGDGEPAKILTTDAVALAAAREVFDAEFANAERQAFAKWLDALDTDAGMITGPGAPALLAALGAEYEVAGDIVVAALLRGHADVPRNDTSRGSKSTLETWLRALPADQAGHILSVFTASLGQKKSLDEQHRLLRATELEKRAAKPIVWPSGTSAEKAAKARAKKGAA